jgi:adenosylcobinamide kinase / adenosylcobinamide-phosphate guanylyltransferase
MARPLVLVLGGTRSGKSSYGLARINALAEGGPVAYLATAIGSPGADPELDDRIARHRAARPDSWDTIEVGVDLPGAMARVLPDRPILVDGMTLWLSALIDTPATELDGIDRLLDGPIAAGLAAVARHSGPVVVVSDEIGLGMVPMDPLSRAFRDLQGIAHQRLAALADEVVLTVAGLPHTLKAPET